MKVATILLALVIPLALMAQNKSAPAKVTYLQVTASELGGHYECIVTVDSIFVNKEYGSEYTRYKRSITSQQRAALFAPFDNVYLSNFKSEYDNPNAPTDVLTFSFFIQKGSASKKVLVYKYKLPPFCNFSAKLNLLLPKDLQLKYDAAYLRD